MSKFKGSQWKCDRKYASYEVLEDEHPKFIVGSFTDGTGVFANISAFEEIPDGLEFFYANTTAWESGECLKTLDEYSKVYEPPFFIRSIYKSDGYRVFSEEVMRLIPIALREQGEPFDEDIYHQTERQVYKTMSEKEFYQMLQKFDINKQNIRIVPDIDQVYRDEYSDWELPQKVHAPDGKIVMSTCQAVFHIFQMLLCWKREECQKCSHEAFEKEVVHFMRTYEMMDGTMFFALDHIEATFPKMKALLCPDCLQNLPKNLQPPLPDKNPTDKISKEDLEQITGEYGVPDPSEYSRISKIIETWDCPVWMLRLFMVGGWLRRVFPLMEEKLKDCILGSAHHLVPKYLRNNGGMDDFMDSIINGFQEKNVEFENVLAKAKSRAEALKQKKELKKKKNQGKSVPKTTEKVPEVPKTSKKLLSDYDERLFHLVNEMRTDEEITKKAYPEKFNRKVQRMEKPLMKKIREESMEFEEAEIVDLKSDEMSKHKERNTTYSQDESSINNVVCNCLLEAGECSRQGAGFTTEKQTTFLQELSEMATQTCQEIMFGGPSEQEKNEPSEIECSHLDELKMKMKLPELPLGPDAIKSLTRLNFKGVVKNPDGSESVKKIGSFELPEGVEFSTGQEEVPSPSKAQADIDALLSKRIAELETMSTPGAVVNERSISLKELHKKSSKGMLDEVDTMFGLPKSNFAKQKKLCSDPQVPKESVEPAKPVESPKPVEPLEKKRPDPPYKQNRAPKKPHKKRNKTKKKPEVIPPEQQDAPKVHEPLEAAPATPEPVLAAPDIPEEPSGPVKKKKWIVPKRKRPDPAYKPNRAPKQARKKRSKTKKEPEIIPLEQPDAPEMSEPLVDAPGPSEPLPAAPDTPEAVQVAPRLLESLQAIPATPELLHSVSVLPEPTLAAPETPELPTAVEDPKAIQLAKALKELRLVKLENKSLKIQIQKYERMEIKMEKMTEEKRELKDKHALEMRGIRKEHADLVKYQQEMIDGLKKKLDEHTKIAAKKVQVLGETQNWRIEYPEQKNPTRESVALRKLIQEIKELKMSREKDAQKIRDLESKLVKLMESTPERLEMSERLDKVRKQNEIQEKKNERLLAELLNLID